MQNQERRGFMLSKTLVLAVVLTGATTTVSATSIGIWSTGACAGANSGATGCGGGQLPFGATDNNYQLTSVPSGSGLPSTPFGAQTESALGNYLVNGTDSEWLTPGE